MFDPEQSQVLDEVLGTLGEAATALQAAETEQQSLRQKQATLEATLSTKVARTDIFSRADVDKLMDKLASLGIVPVTFTAKAATHLCEHPEAALSFIEQIADVLVSPVPEGAGIPKVAAGVRDEVPDGWGDFIAGRPVRIRR